MKRLPFIIVILVMAVRVWAGAGGAGPFVPSGTPTPFYNIVPPNCITDPNILASTNVTFMAEKPPQWPSQTPFANYPANNECVSIYRKNRAGQAMICIYQSNACVYVEPGLGQP